MKRLLFIITFLWIFSLSYSQVSSYVFSETTGTYTAVTLGTQLVTTTAGATTYDTDGSYFTLSSINQFNFNGTTITSVNMTADGALWLNPITSTTGNGTTGAIASSSTAIGIICPLNVDLRSSQVASTIYERRWYNDGTELIFQWQNCARYGSSSTEKISFQVRVNKSTGVIRVIYGAITVTTSVTYQPYVGLRGSANTDFNNRRLTASIPDATPGWAGSAGTAAGTTNAHTCRFLSTASCFPSSGLIFIWTPKPIITPSVSTLSVFSSCSGNSSSIQNFTVTGTNMLASITITPPVGFEVSTSSSFASSIGTNSSALVIGAAGTITSTTIYVRLQSTASTGTPSGNITLVSVSATTKNIAISGNVGINLSSVVVSSSTLQSICLGSNGTSVSVVETGGGTITARQWGKRPTSGGSITNVTGTSSSYTPSGTDFITVGTYYLVCTSTPTCGSPMVSNEITITIVGSPATPGVPTTNSPQCSTPGVTLTANGSAPPEETWYWQTTNTGIETTSFASTYIATTAGTYYIRSKYASGGCWGVSSSVAIIISTVPTSPSLTSPTTAATGVTLTPTLTWGAVAGATSYDVYIGTTLPISATTNVITNSYSPSTLLNGTTYSWKVIAKNGCGSSVVSSTYTFTTAVVNDNSNGAIDLIINSSTTCTTTTTGTSIGATQTLAAQSLYGTADDDVWYKFTATDVNLNMTVTRGTMGDLVVEGYTSSLVSIGVVDATLGTESISFTNLTIGNVYYIRVYSYAGTVGSRGTFTICITTPTQPPSNDNASGAITLIVNNPYITGTNDGATASTTAPTPTGPAYYGGDVWYKVVIPVGGIIQFRTSALVLTDIVLELYSGTSSSLTYICYNDDSLVFINEMPYIELTGRTVGETIWARIWDYSGDNSGTFQIRTSTPVVLPISLMTFTGHNTVDGNSIEWKTASEVNSDYFTLSRGLYRNGSVEWLELQFINGSGNSNIINTYGYFDLDYPDDINYYQLTQTDFDGNSVTYDIISIDNRLNKKEISSITNILGQEVNENYRGLLIITYIDGSVEKTIK